jgi:hypothetical protein
MQETTRVSVSNTVTGQFCKYDQKHQGGWDFNERQQNSGNSFRKGKKYEGKSEKKFPYIITTK